MLTRDDIYRRAAEILESGRSLVLATLVSAAGSTPRDAGAGMLVLPDGSIVGTIGGGLIEARVTAQAVEALWEKRSALRSFNLSAQPGGEGMLCGGRAEVLLQFLDGATDDSAKVFRALAEAAKSSAAAARLSVIDERGGAFAVSTCLLTDGKVVAGAFPEVDEAGRLLRGAAAARRIELQTPTAGLRIYVEPFRPAVTALIFGAGHVSLALAPVCRAVGFHTVVLDDREEYASKERFPQADQVLAVESFERACEWETLEADDFVLIITRGHAHDLTVLRKALRTRAGYLGMIGSIRKREVLFAGLKAEGFTDDDLKRVHSPIGLAIGAEGPEEIAVSITAELIRERAALFRSPDHDSTAWRR